MASIQSNSLPEPAAPRQQVLLRVIEDAIARGDDDAAVGSLYELLSDIMEVVAGAFHRGDLKTCSSQFQEAGALVDEIVLRLNETHPEVESLRGTAHGLRGAGLILLAQSSAGIDIDERCAMLDEAGERLRNAELVGRAFFPSGLTIAISYELRAGWAASRLRFPEAAAFAQRALSAVQRAVEEADDDDAGKLVGILLTASKSASEMVSFQARVASGEYALAVEHGEAALESHHHAVAQLADADLPLGGVAVATHVMQAEVARARALAAREEHRWDVSWMQYNVARTEWYSAAQSALNWELYGPSLQSILIGKTVSLEVEIRQMQRERAAWQERLAIASELDELKRAVFGKLAPGAVNVHTTAEAVSAIQHTNQIVHQIELSVRGTVQDLLQQLSELGDNGSPIGEQLREIVEDPESGQGFLERARARVASITAIAKDSATLYATMSPLLRVLARQVGLEP